jgi:hypothetical protein
LKLEIDDSAKPQKPQPTARESNHIYRISTGGARGTARSIIQVSGPTR